MSPPAHWLPRSDYFFRLMCWRKRSLRRRPPAPPAIFCSLRSKETLQRSRALGGRAKGRIRLETKRCRSGLSRHRQSVLLRLMVVQMDLAPATLVLILRTYRSAGNAPARPRAARRQPTKLLRLLRRRKRVPALRSLYRRHYRRKFIPSRQPAAWGQPCRRSRWMRR